MKRLATIAILTILCGIGFAVNPITAEESQSQYHFAENTTVSGIFHYATGKSEIIPFEVFEQEQGFNRMGDPIFHLEKVVGNTPSLHHLADESMVVTRGSQTSDFVLTDVDILISHEGKVIRQLDYNRCIVTDYKITTMHDDDAGWHATDGFSLVDQFQFTCDGYTPSSPVYDHMDDVEQADTLSSNDLKDTSTWPQNMIPN